MIHKLPLTAKQVARILDVCQTAASRKVALAEMFISQVVLPASRHIAESNRPDRVRQAIVARLTILGRLMSEQPEAVDRWIGRLVASEASPSHRTDGTMTATCGR